MPVSYTHLDVYKRQVLDRLEADDIGAYRAALEELPEREKICGFFSGRAELAAWERSDLFQFVHDTIPFYGCLLYTSRCV